ncbi:MAG: DUF2125 domain-containing protein, partial [Caulobacteraceae bacterium]
MNPTPQPWSFHDDPPPRKPRRRVLYAIWGAVIVVAAGWSLAWLFMMGQVEQRLDAGAAALKTGGWRVSWSARHVGGYPFRLDIDLSDVRLADPSGWAAAAPQVKSEAYAFAPDRWVFYLPAGLAFVRPGAGAVTVAAKVLRGSVNG